MTSGRGDCTELNVRARAMSRRVALAAAGGGSDRVVIPAVVRSLEERCVRAVKMSRCDAGRRSVYRYIQRGVGTQPGIHVEMATT